jgi:hypothetical protein
MPQRQSANADGEDARDDARPVAKLCNRDGKVIVQKSLLRNVGYVTRALSTERAGVEADADPRRWHISKDYSRHLVGGSVQERGGRARRVQQDGRKWKTGKDVFGTRRYSCRSGEGDRRHREVCIWQRLSRPPADPHFI